LPFYISAYTTLNELLAVFLYIITIKTTTTTPTNTRKSTTTQYNKKGREKEEPLHGGREK